MSNFNINGPFIFLSIDASNSNEIKINLPNGYTYERICINRVKNISALFPNLDIHTGDHITFPVVNGKSPAALHLYIANRSLPSEISLTIEKFGQIPDYDYFENTFNPIFVTSDDGRKYKVIPSDQFK